jgi:hypothetical protein
MSVASAEGINPSVFGGGGGTTLPYIAFSNPAPVVYTTNTSLAVYTSASLDAGTYLISAHGLIQYTNGATQTPQLAVITATDDNQNQNEVQNSFDFTGGNSIQITAIHTYSVPTQLKIYMECFDFTTNWTLQNLDVNVVQIA